MDGTLLEGWSEEGRMEVLLFEKRVLGEEVDSIVFSDFDEESRVAVPFDKHFREAKCIGVLEEIVGLAVHDEHVMAVLDVEELDVANAMVLASDVEYMPQIVS